MKHMSKNKTLFCSALIPSILLASCGAIQHKSVYEVDPELEPYIHLFEERAFEQHLTITISDIKVYFVDDLGQDESSVTLAVCMQYTTDDGMNIDTPEIQVDRNEFKRITGPQHEALMFHELGHCVLHRDHDDTRVPAENNRYESIMSTYIVSSYMYTHYYEAYMHELFTGR